MRLEKELFDIEWLKQALTSGWLAKHLDAVRGSGPLPDEAVNRDFRALLAEGNYLLAAQALIEACDRGPDEPGPFEIAMAEDNVELVLALLALTDVAAYGFENNLLAMAVAHDRRDIFNLLLLHPDIEIQCSYEVDREAREVAEFCGVGDWCDHFCPHMWLLEAQYEPLYPVLDIDWQFPVDGDAGAPLLVHLYHQRDFVGMNRLVAIGADINPAIDEWDQSMRLIHVALEDWRDDKPATQAGLRWFARYLSFLNDPSFGGDVLSDLLSLDKPQIVELFQLQAISYQQDTLNEQISALQRQQSELEEVLYTPLPYSPRHHLQACSLADDLLRLRLVEFVAEVEDLQFVISDAGIEFGVCYQDCSFSQSVLLPTRLLTALHFESPLPIQAMTLFQCQMWLLTCPAELYLCLNVLAQDAGKPLFRSIKGHPICDTERQLKMSEILATGGIEGECFLVELLLSELDRFESILRYLSEEKLLNTPFSAEQLLELKEWRAQEVHTRPKLALAVSEHNDSEHVRVRALIDEQWCDLGARPIDYDWAGLLFEAPNFIPCQQCGEIGYRHGLAYEQECMECFNGPG